MEGGGAPKHRARRRTGFEVWNARERRKKLPAMILDEEEFQAEMKVRTEAWAKKVMSARAPSEAAVPARRVPTGDVVGERATPAEERSALMRERDAAIVGLYNAQDRLIQINRKIADHRRLKPLPRGRKPSPNAKPGNAPQSE